jgi:hypothetical protein
VTSVKRSLSSFFVQSPHQWQRNAGRRSFLRIFARIEPSAHGMHQEIRKTHAAKRRLVVIILLPARHFPLTLTWENVSSYIKSVGPTRPEKERYNADEDR